MIDRHVRLGEGAAGRLVKENRSYMRVRNYNGWEGRVCGFNKGALLEVPLKRRGEIVGVLYVEDQAGREFTSDDIRILQLFADHAAIAMANAQLLLQSENARRELEDSFEASIGLMVSKEPRHVCEDAVRQARRMAGAAWARRSIN